MLLKEKTTVKFDKPLPKVLCVSAAFNNTFVMVRMDKPCQEETIVHFDASGNILFERKYNDIIDMFGQMNEKEVIVLDVRASMIDIINLQTHEVIHVNHQYTFEDTAQMQIYNFPQSRTFCVQEKGSFGEHRLKLSYYSVDNLGKDSKPEAIYDSKDNEWTYDHVIYKGNNHSKVIWFTYKHEQQVTFTYFDLKDKPEGSLNVVKAVNTLGHQYNINNLQLNIGGIWEMKKNQYAIVATSNRNELKPKKEKEVINNNYILDTSLGNDKGTLRQSKFVFEIAEDGFCWNDQLIDFFGVGNVSVFHSFRHDKGKTLESPVYYVNNETQEIIYQQKWFSTCYASNYYFPGWDGNTMVQTYFENGDVQSMDISIKKVMDPKEISLHFLLHMNEDFDDDLLQDAIELLHVE